MAKKGAPPCLIALEGNGLPLGAAARELLRALKRGRSVGGISKWDASGIFYEIQRGDTDLPAPSARTLLLLYSADLVFRLRWEVRPFLDEGKCVIVAPYVQTAMAFGKAAGLPGTWMRELFSFAPAPDASYRIPDVEGEAAWHGKPSAGFLEFCCSAMPHASRASAHEIRTRAGAYLNSLEKRSRCQALTPELMAELT